MRAHGAWIVIAAVLAGCGGNAGPMHGMVIDPPQEAPVIHLPHVSGQAFDLDKERGRRRVLLFFGYTHCPDVCPTTLSDWARVKKSLGMASAGVRFVFVSVDPSRDTPKVVQDYASQFDQDFVGLATTPATLDTLKKAWGFDVMRDSLPGSKPGEYGVTHPAGTFAIDRVGKIRVIYAPNAKPDDIAADIRRIP